MSSDNNAIETPVELLTKIISLKPGGEVRSQQAEAVAKIGEAIAETNNLLVEAPTGSGKTIGYMVPVIFHGAKAVISTATKQLSEQIVNVDVPFLQKALREVDPTRKFTASLLKGRDNYYCLAKADEQGKLSDDANSLFRALDIENTKASPTSAKGKQMAKEMKALENWADTTKTGDRSEAPAVSDQVWRQYSSSTAECPGKKVCPFGESCFAEFARDKARKVDVVITNHAVVAHDLMAEENSLLGERDTFVFDELHELDNYLSSAWGTRLSAKMLKDAHKVFKTLSELKEEDVDEIEKMGKKFNGVVNSLEEGLMESTPHLVGQLLSRIYGACAKIIAKAQKSAQDKEERENIRKIASVVVKKANEILEAAQLLLDDGPSTVRWVTIQEDETRTLNAAPLRVGPQLQQALETRNATMIGTSATIRVSGKFEIPVHNLDLDTSVTPYKTVALDSPFDYAKQAMIYIPDANSFPAPVGQERKEHAEAVKKEAEELIRAMNGRALGLFTTTSAARDNAEYLRKKFPKMNILLQGDAPLSQLIEEFKKDENSVLLGTMGIWHGLDVVGPALSLVIIDKIPFKPQDDPLSKARRQAAEEAGRNGFMDIYVADANVMLSQGVGRLVRSKGDKGIIAILDTRLATKPYGRNMLKSMPPAKIFQDKKTVINAAKRLGDSLDKK